MFLKVHNNYLISIFVNVTKIKRRRFKVQPVFPKKGLVRQPHQSHLQYQEELSNSIWRSSDDHQCNHCDFLACRAGTQRKISVVQFHSIAIIDI